MADLDIACPKCATTADLVVTGLDVAAMLGRYADEENECQWVVTCFACQTKMRINDAARDALFGTAWRDKSKETTNG